MEGKVCLVTGATSGIGASTALGLARRGATVVVAGRDSERCAATCDRIRRETGNPAVHSLMADLSSQAQVHRLARQFQDTYPRLDVLVNNAGGVFARRRLSADGIEMTFALNHLGYFLLTRLLFDMLETAAPSRIVNVASCGHELIGGMNFDDLQYERRYQAFPAYFQSKLANLLFSYELARRIEKSGVTVNALHPGIVATRFGRNNGWGWRLVKPLVDRVYRLHYISAEEGARTVIYLASSPDVEGVTGRYFVEEREAPSSAASRDEAAARRLWQISEAMTGTSLTAGSLPSQVFHQVP